MQKLTNKHLKANYGKSVRARMIRYYNLAHATYNCHYCNYLRPSVKRVATGIWECRFCNIKFAGEAYTPIE